MKYEKLPHFSPLRGVRWGILYAIVGALACVSLTIGYTVLPWLWSGATPFERQEDLQWNCKMMLGPTLGCAAFFGCTGWVSSAPAGDFRFVRSLVLLFLVSIPISLAALPFVPREFKGEPMWSNPLARGMLLLCPLVVTTAFLTVTRACRRSTPDLSLE